MRVVTKKYGIHHALAYMPIIVTNKFFLCCGVFLRIKKCVILINVCAPTPDLVCILADGAR